MTIQSFKIGHHQYSVEYVDDLVHQGEVVNGWCHGDKKKIKINTTDNAPSCITETLIHEVMHGIFHESSIEDDEEMVTRLSKTLHGFLKNNIDTLNEMYQPNHKRHPRIELKDFTKLEEKLEEHKPRIENAIKNAFDEFRAEVSE